ncbi:hypothetical protein [uncultured Paludibaculum sp.]|uniref:hypothetical protein n=1 Tax=uncultured Paludibaculum sp. TaxID=1765020 RepID=UPI002AAC3D6C|nr:hypothetical protein [uncultured Paludibaculum sp.]
MSGLVLGFRIQWEPADGPHDFARAGVDPAGVTVECLKETVLAEHPGAGAFLIAIFPCESGFDEGSFAAFVERAVTFQHVVFEEQGPELGIRDVSCLFFRLGAEVGFEARRHAMVRGVGSGAAGVAGDGRLTGGGARAC